MILDVIGGDYVDRNLQAVAVKGRIVQVGLMAGGATPREHRARCCPSGLSLIGTVLRARPIEEKIALTRRFAAEVLPLFDGGALPPGDRPRYPLDQIADAHRHMESNANVGKILVDVA